MGKRGLPICAPRVTQAVLAHCDALLRFSPYAASLSFVLHATFYASLIPVCLCSKNVSEKCLFLRSVCCTYRNSSDESLWVLLDFLCAERMSANIIVARAVAPDTLSSTINPLAVEADHELYANAQQKTAEPSERPAK